MTEFTKGDRVYTQDGTEYYFDHVAGDHGYVSPFFIIQTTNYHGDDFDEHEEVADHMVPIKLTSLSLKPWVRKIHEETAEALAEQKGVLGGIQKEIGAARTELRTAENDLKDAEKRLEAEARALAIKYTFVRDFRILTGDNPPIVLDVGEDIPSDIGQPRTLYISPSEDGKYEYRTEYWDETSPVKIFENKYQMETYVRKAFNAREDKSIEHELAWCYRYDFLVPSPEAEEYKGRKALEAFNKKLTAAQNKVKAAQAELDAMLPDPLEA